MSTVCVIQARMGSSRLPGKVLKTLAGAPLILRLVERVEPARTIDSLVVATTTLPNDDRLAEVLAGAGVEVHRGDVDDVLGRLVGVLTQHPHDVVVRLTGDNPMVDAKLVDTAVEAHLGSGVDYTSTEPSQTFPYGYKAEVVSAAALRDVASRDTTAAEREHVTLGILNRPREFTLHAVGQDVDRSSWRWTVDLPEDLEWARSVFEELYPNNPHFGQEDVARLIAERPELERTMDDVS